MSTELVANVGDLTEAGVKLDAKSITKHKKKDPLFANKASTEYNANRYFCDINLEGFRRRESHTKPNVPPARKRAPPKAK